MSIPARAACICIIFALNFGICGSAGAEPDKISAKCRFAPHTVWQMDMESAAGGIYHTWLTDNAVKVESPSFGYVLYAKSPDWKVYAFRPQSKEVCVVGFKQFLQEREGVVGTMSVLDLQKPLKVTPRQFVFRRSGKVLKLDGWDYKFAGEQRANDLFVTAGKPEKTESYVTSTADLGLPKPVYDMVAVTVNMPRLNGCLLTTMEYFQAGNVCWVIRNRSIAPMEAPPADLFKMPVGYKNAGPFKRQFLFKGASSIMDEVAQDLGPANEGSGSKGKTGNRGVPKGR